MYMPYALFSSTCLGEKSYWILLHSMATTIATTVLQNRSRIFLGLFVILVVVLFLVDELTIDLGKIAMEIRMKLHNTSSTKANRSRRSHAQFVTMCPANFNGRRLGNQLFNWAAMLYVAQLTGSFQTFRPGTLLFFLLLLVLRLFHFTTERRQTFAHTHC